MQHNTQFGDASETPWDAVLNTARYLGGERRVFAPNVGDIGYWVAGGNEDVKTAMGNTICQGKAFLKNAATAPAASTWTTKNDFDQDVSVTAECLAYGIVPPWVNPVGGAVTYTDPDTGQPKTVNQNADGSYGNIGPSISDVGNIVNPFAAIPTWLPWAVGGVGVLVLLLILVPRR